VAPPDLSQFEEKIRTLAQYARAMHERGYYTLAEIKGPFETPWMFLRGFVPYLKDLATDPDFITKMIEVSFKPMMELAEMVIDQAPFDGVWITDDLGERSYPFLSVDKYRRIYKPWHQQAVNRLHKKGVKDNKFDSLDPLEPADNMNLAELKAKYGDRITLMGGITRDIGTMTTEQIENHVQQVIRAGGPCGLILNCGGGIPPEMRLERLMSYCAAVQKYRRVLDS
jgi:uroporphyrinogen decarboxylase